MIYGPLYFLHLHVLKFCFFIKSKGQVISHVMCHMLSHVMNYGTSHVMGQVINHMMADSYITCT
jgi:hypothetical protein